MKEYREPLEELVKLYKENKLIFKCAKNDIHIMLNYKLPLPKIPVIVRKDGSMLCYNEILYYLIRCIVCENISEYNSLESYQKNNIESKYIDMIWYEPYSDNFSYKELEISFNNLNNREYSWGFIDDYINELNKIGKRLLRDEKE